MAIIAWPTERILGPGSIAWGEDRIVRGSGQPVLGADEQFAEIPYSHRWVVDVTMLSVTSFAERARQEAWISRLAGGANRTTFHHFQHPRPYGTLRGNPTLNGAHAQGAKTLSVKGANGETLLEGDMLGVTTTAAYAIQLVRVTEGGVVSGGVVTVSIEAALRAAANDNAAVIWDRPAALFRLMSGNWKQSSSARRGEPITLQFREVLS